MKTKFIGTFRGFKVDSVPDDAWAGHIAIPESMVKYIQELEEIKNKYNQLRMEEIFKWKEKI